MHKWKVTWIDKGGKRMHVPFKSLFKALRQRRLRKSYRHNEKVRISRNKQFGIKSYDKGSE